MKQGNLEKWTDSMNAYFSKSKNELDSETIKEIISF